jgi:hypothetical protein
MLRNSSTEPPRPTTITQNSQIIPDPWELETPTPQAQSDTLPTSWQFPTEVQPLISAATPLELLKLPSPKFNQIRIFLEDWLKLKVEDAQKLTVQLNNALTLLFWLGMEGQPEA